MAARFITKDKELKKALKNATAEGITRASVQYHTHLKLALNVPNTGVDVKVKRQTPGGNTSTRRIYPDPSTPPDPPRKRTGDHIQAHVVRETDRTIPAARIGVSKAGIIGLYHELGTKHLPRRIWLMSTLTRNKLLYGKLLTTGADAAGL